MSHQEIGFRVTVHNSFSPVLVRLRYPQVLCKLGGGTISAMLTRFLELGGLMSLIRESGGSEGCLVPD